MLNGAMKEKAIEELKTAEAKREAEGRVVREASAELFDLRKSSSEKVISQVEIYINALANTPQEFEKAFSEYRVEFKTFKKIISDIEEEALKIDVKAGTGAAAGVAAGVGIAAFAPTVAMSIATTFGTASTGTAISSLTGAVATRAALAWLGGGALAAGGGGVLAGETLLALAGPVGWVVGGVSVVVSGLFVRSRNQSIAEQATVETKKIQAHIAALSAAKVEVNRLFSLTKRHVNGVTALLDQLKERAPGDYMEFSTVQKEWLGALINHVHSLSELLNKKVQA